MNMMHSLKVVVKPDETPGDIIEQICTQEKIRQDDHFSFSAIMTRDRDDPDYYNLKINCIEPQSANPYTPSSLVYHLYDKRRWSKDASTRYVVPPLELYLSVFRPMLHKMISKAHPYYQKLIPEREEMMCIINLVIVKLYDKGYYLHNHLIYKAFINELNLEVRKIKNFSDMVSLDEEINSEDGEKTMTRLDQVECPVSTAQAHAQGHYTLEDYWQDMFEKIKDYMLQDMSQLSFDRILIQLKSRTVDTGTSRVLQKYREIFNPGCPARPNAFGKPKGGNKK